MLQGLFRLNASYRIIETLSAYQGRFQTWCVALWWRTDPRLWRESRNHAHLHALFPELRSFTNYVLNYGYSETPDWCEASTAAHSYISESS